MNNLHYQRGMSSLAWLLVLMTGGFALLCAFKIIPLYAENRYISQALIFLSEKDVPLEDMSTGEIKKAMNNFYTINNVRSEGSRNIKVERTRKAVLVSVNYETRVPLVSNIDVVVSFENQLDSSRPGECCKP